MQISEPRATLSIDAIAIIENGLVLGGIGVSGANQQIDDDVADAALRALAG